jgi:hypothetical protein
MIFQPAKTGLIQCQQIGFFLLLHSLQIFQNGGKLPGQIIGVEGGMVFGVIHNGLLVIPVMAGVFSILPNYP